MNTVQTSDLGLTAALLSQGCKLDGNNPFQKFQTESGTTMTFFFEADEHIKEFMAIWDDPQKDPEHPIAHMRIFNTNRIGLTKEAKEATGLVQIVKNNKSVIISSNASDEVKRKLLSRL